jgi:hypothetical protein
MPQDGVAHMVAHVADPVTHAQANGGEAGGMVAPQAPFVRSLSFTSDSTPDAIKWVQTRGLLNLEGSKLSARPTTLRTPPQVALRKLPNVSHQRPTQGSLSKHLLCTNKLRIRTCVDTSFSSWGIFSIFLSFLALRVRQTTVDYGGVPKDRPPERYALEVTSGLTLVVVGLSAASGGRWARGARGAQPARGAAVGGGGQP